MTSLTKTLAFGLTAVAFAASASAQTKWDLASGYSSNTFQTKNLEQFAADVKEATGGQLLITVHPGASLFKQPEIKRAIQTGLTPAGEFIISGLANENPIFGADSIPFLATSYADAKKLYDATKPVQAAVLGKQGIKVLFSVPWPGQSLYSVNPINSADDFKGTKMRTYNPATTKIAQMLGASPVTIQLPELGQALATGAANNFLTSSASGADGKLYEQVKYFYPVNGWLPRNVTAVSVNAFNGLNKAMQDAVLKAAADAEMRGWKMSEQVDTDSIAILKANGVTIAPPSDSVKAALQKIGEQMTEEWLASAGAEGKTIIDAYRKK
jgi:TRAP-type C4-dicarboxylate transport system substrate-binding protein